MTRILIVEDEERIVVLPREGPARQRLHDGRRSATATGAVALPATATSTC